MDCIIRRQLEEDNLKPFTCGDMDLDEFFKQDAIHYMEQKIATSYVIEDDTGLLAYFSIANDRISIDDFNQKTGYNRFRRRFANVKRLRGYPAIKLCRLAVNNAMKGRGIGTSILNFLKATYHKHQRSACRFLVVDAYGAAADFYIKNGFIPVNEDQDSARQTIPMYFDLADLDRP
jgi:predicted GNAT family N-acyltransferase